MTPEQEQFVNTMGDTMAAWNLPRATGRMYGFLLLKGAPSSSDDLRAALGLSSGAVSTAIRELVSWGLARTLPQPGSRRLLVEATGGLDQLLAASIERARTFIRALQDAEELTETVPAAARLRDVTDLFTAYVDAGGDALRRHRQTERTRPSRETPATAIDEGGGDDSAPAPSHDKREHGTA